MKIINLECFNNLAKMCLVTSEAHSIEINNPLDKTAQIKVINHSVNNCKVSLQLIGTHEEKLWQELPLSILSGDQLLFRGLTSELFAQEQPLGSVLAREQLELTFDFDLLSLMLTVAKAQLNFDLWLNFSCLENEATMMAPQAASSAVLAVNDAVPPPTEQVNWLFYLLSGLFVICFFVIIKFVHGKKKKKIR